MADEVWDAGASVAAAIAAFGFAWATGEPRGLRLVAISAGVGFGVFVFSMAVGSSFLEGFVAAVLLVVPVALVVAPYFFNSRLWATHAPGARLCAQAVIGLIVLVAARFARDRVNRG